MGYQRNPDWSFEDQAAEAIGGWIAGLIFLLLFIALMVIVTLIWVLITELVRVYRRPAFTDPRSQVWLQWAFLSFLLVLGLAGTLALASPVLGPPAAVVAAWSVLAFVVVVEVIDRRERQFEQLAADEVEADQFDRLFDPWSTEGQSTPDGVGEPMAASWG
jgi:quinol-cytochrome oxidoreductase complex cytochrome b subunit